MDIAYGDVTAPGGIKYTLLVVDRKTRFTYTLPLKNCKGESIILCLKKLKTMEGKLPTKFYTDFDAKLLSETVTTFCAEHKSLLLAAPSDQQHQNGLVE